VRYVLDTSALLSGRAFEGELYITPEVMRELRKFGITPQLEAFLDNKVRVLTPGKESIHRVRRKAEETGDTKRLSPADIGVLALAVELGATLLTDDYSIENIAKAMGIPYETVMMPAIKEEVHWRYRCTGCLKFWREWHGACPVCGAPLRTSRSKK
jgi:UPF0271 protein